MAEKELQVVVTQEVGVISWNFEEIKPVLVSMMKDYEGIVYTEENVKLAKNDIAFLRKVKKAISDKRIEIKNKCLEPYEIFEKQAAELTEMIDKPIAMIDVQLEEYEKNRKEEVRGKILAYFDEFGSGLIPDAVLKQVKSLKYSDKWENVTTSVKRWKQGVEDAVRASGRDIAWIEETVEEEFREMAVDAYCRKLQLTDVMDTVTKARKQKEMILARERERIAAEERAKAEAEIKARMEAEKKTEVTVEQKTPSDARSTPEKAPEPVKATIPNPVPQNSNLTPSRASENSETEIRTLRIKATKEQFNKIKGYIAYCGAVYREV